MLEIIGQISISEVILLFVLLFVLPLNFLLVKRLRQYETQGAPPGEKSTAKAPPAGAAEKPAPPAAPPNVYPYVGKAFLSPPEKACIEALQGALGDEVDVFPKVALWECLESSDKNPAFTERLYGLRYDFLICDRKLGHPMTAIMFRPGKGRPAGRTDDLRKACEAAGANVVFIDMAEHYDAQTLKKELGIPDLDL